MIDPAEHNAIIAANPLIEYCRRIGLELRRVGNEWKCLCPLHTEQTPSFTVDAKKDLFYCHGCGVGGSVIDLHAKLRTMSIGEAMRDLSPYGDNNGDGTRGSREKQEPASSQDGEKPKSAGTQDRNPASVEIAAYDYQDATGRVRFQVVRFEPKTFKQCHIDQSGARVWNMDGVERLPYRLPEVLAADTEEVWIVEGEKDVETLRQIKGTVATCNPGGAGKWLPAFSQHLRGKSVFIVPDRDDSGAKHAANVLASLAGLVKWVKWIELPPEHKGRAVKDISDLRAACDSLDDFAATLELLKAKARLIERGIDSDAYTMAELEAQYIAEKTVFGDVSLDLNRWLPALCLRALGPGDLMGLIAGTGQCKTACIQNILACNAELPGILFELELSGPQMFERSAAVATGYDAWRISQYYDKGERIDWWTSGKFNHLLTCTATLSMLEIDERIGRASAKLGCIPRVFVIDYAQLVRGSGSRYERMSATCEEAKRLAKKWNAVGIIVSQVARPDDDSNPEVSLYDAKESGSFENSCGLVLGVWKTSKTDMVCKVLKTRAATLAGLSGCACAAIPTSSNRRLLPWAYERPGHFSPRKRDPSWLASGRCGVIGRTALNSLSTIWLSSPGRLLSRFGRQTANSSDR